MNMAGDRLNNVLVIIQTLADYNNGNNISQLHIITNIHGFYYQPLTPDKYHVEISLTGYESMFSTFTVCLLF